MKWNDCRGEYTAYISLGSTCQTAYQLKRLGLRKFSGPLDWFISFRAHEVARLLRNRFDGFMELDQLRLSGMDLNCYVVTDDRYDIVSYHDFPLSLSIYRWTDAYPAFKRKIDRRINRFLTAAKSKPICLVRTQTSKPEAEKLYASLHKVMPGKFRLLIVNNMDYLHELGHEDWGLHGVCSVSVPKGMDWRGSNQAWDQIMKGFKLKP